MMEYIFIIIIFFFKVQWDYFYRWLSLVHVKEVCECPWKEILRFLNIDNNLLAKNDSIFFIYII